LSIRRQCELLGRSRSWYYYRGGRNSRRQEHEQRLATVAEEVHAEIPFYGYRKAAFEAAERGWDISVKQMLRVRRENNIRALRLPPPTSTPRTAHARYPYLLDNREITEANEVWQVDITYVRLPGGTVYLCAIIDVATRRVLAWNLSNTMETLLVLMPLAWALERYGIPEIINSDQGSQFTTVDWISILETTGIRVSMDGKGRAVDNIYIERWWNTFKYENLYLNQYATMGELRRGIERYVHFYNHRRFHQALGYRRPAEVFAEYTAGRVSQSAQALGA
jgi:putative transposase